MTLNDNEKRANGESECGKKYRSSAKWENNTVLDITVYNFQCIYTMGFCHIYVHAANSAFTLCTLPAPAATGRIGRTPLPGAATRAITAPCAASAAAIDPRGLVTHPWEAHGNVCMPMEPPSRPDIQGMSPRLCGRWARHSNHSLRQLIAMTRSGGRRGHLGG